uniref:Predicted protein n=1 Tax=Physcomitrium patens TaxID=3218 RepID=A9U747_PHYPA
MAERELAGLRESAATYEGELKRSKLRLAIERSKPDDPVQLTKRLLHCLYFEQDLLCKSLPQGEGGSDQRQKIRKLFDLIDQLEQSIQEEVPTPVESPPAAVVSPPQAEEDDVESIPGTFYRGDHGGRIYLENREAFNITESMVHDHHLQHEAEVQCKPSHQENSHIQYEIERILFQGDDRYSPVRHFMGYVELGEHFTWYCVDMNNSENRYLLHDKDVHIQKPQDGDACAFNVLAGNHVARLSRLYREMPVEDKSQSVKKYPVKKEEDKSKRAPFLTGCRIVIIGGLAKWFESVITETGAELECWCSDIILIVIFQTGCAEVWMAKGSGEPYNNLFHP